MLHYLQLLLVFLLLRWRRKVTKPNRTISNLSVLQSQRKKRVQSTQEVPISVATLGGEKFDAIFAGGDDIQALAVKVPGLYAESSNGRAAPRFLHPWSG